MFKIVRMPNNIAKETSFLRELTFLRGKQTIIPQTNAYTVMYLAERNVLGKKCNKLEQ